MLLLYPLPLEGGGLGWGWTRRRRAAGLPIRSSPTLPLKGRELQRRAQGLDVVVEDAVVIGIVDGAIDDVDARRAQAGGEQVRQRLGALHPVPLRSVALGVFHEIGIAVGQPPILEA